jgi:endoplasmic reticulum-Golgi intermediate compartment protein 3
VDAVDYNGEQQIGVEHEIYKSSRGDKGQDLGMYKLQTEMGSFSGETYLPADYCGSCYGAAPSGYCCNTCEDLKTAYRKYGRSESLASTSAQCIREKKYGSLPNEAGCRVRGTLRVNKVRGKLIFIHFQPQTLTKFVFMFVFVFAIVDGRKFPCGSRI